MPSATTRTRGRAIHRNKTLNSPQRSTSKQSRVKRSRPQIEVKCRGARISRGKDLGPRWPSGLFPIAGYRDRGAAPDACERLDHLRHGDHASHLLSNSANSRRPEGHGKTRQWEAGVRSRNCFPGAHHRRGDRSNPSHDRDARRPALISREIRQRSANNSRNNENLS
jgi:hypothetical protein